MRKNLLIVWAMLAQSLAVAAQDIHACLENDRVRAFLDEVVYERDSESAIALYNVAPPARRDVPLPAVVPIPGGVESDAVTLLLSENGDMSEALQLTGNTADGRIEVYNLTPERTYYYELRDGAAVVAEGRIFTIGRVRMIYLPSMFNVRDCGGWTTVDGRRMKYGLVYRGGEMNGLNVASEEDLEAMKALGIGAEIDMRYEGERDEVDAAGISALGFSTGDKTYLCTDNSGATEEHLAGYYWRLRYKRELQFIVDNLKAGRAVYQHCIWGADRTGMLSLLLEGVLGVGYDQMAKDFELSSMSAEVGIRVKTSHVDAIIDYIDQLSGETLQEKFNYYLTRSVGMAQADIDYLRETLLEDIPEFNPDYDYVTTGLSSTVRSRADNGHACHDLTGRPAGSKAKGIVISGGKKVMVSGR